nr:uncharacterized protein I203_06035 [Kwoniella mangroviensis CBS 8507]OCF64791.1 hypothetical protein I203_06035 [Kwoniella mangroviensis CBS 8507]
MSDRGTTFQPSSYDLSEIPAIFLPDEIDLSETTLSNHRDLSSSSSTRSKRPSILPKRDSLPPPPRPKSTSSSRRTSAQSSPVTYSRTDEAGCIDFTKDPFESAFQKAKTQRELDRKDEMRLTHDQQGAFEILQKEELHRTKTVSILEGRFKPSDRNISSNSNGLKLEFMDKDDHKSFHNMEVDEGNEKDQKRMKTPKTPKKFIQDHFTLKTPRMPVPFTAKSLPIPVPIPTHINLPTPIMPIIHLLLVISHLVLSALLPHLLFKNFIQPLVFISLVVYGFGFSRSVPVYARGRDSAWLQSGLHLVMMILSLAPHAASVFLMSKIIRPQCQHEATLKYVLKHHADLAVTSYLVKYYNLEPFVTHGRMPGKDQQLDYSKILFGLIGQLGQNVEDPDSQKWLSALTSPKAWHHIKKLAAAFEQSEIGKRAGVKIEGETICVCQHNVIQIARRYKQKIKAIDSQPAAFTSADTLDRRWVTAGIQFDPDKLPTLYRNEHVTIDIDFFAQADEQTDTVCRVWHNTVFGIIKDSLKKYTESDPAIMIATRRLLSNKTLSYLALHYGLFDPSKSLPSQRVMGQRMRKYVALLVEQNAEHGSRQDLMSWVHRLWTSEAWPTLQDVILEAQNRQSFNFDVKTSEMSALATVNNENGSYISSPSKPKQDDDVNPSASSGGLRKSELLMAEGETANPEVYEILKPDSKELVSSDYRTNMDFLTQSLRGRWDEENAILLASKILLETSSLIPLPPFYGLDRDQRNQLLAPEVSVQLFRRYTALLLKRAAKESRMIKLNIEDWLRQVYSPDSRPGLRLHVRAKLREQR